MPIASLVAQKTLWNVVSSLCYDAFDNSHQYEFEDHECLWNPVDDNKDTPKWSDSQILKEEYCSKTSTTYPSIIFINPKWITVFMKKTTTFETSVQWRSIETTDRTFTHMNTWLISCCLHMSWENGLSGSFCGSCGRISFLVAVIVYMRYMESWQPNDKWRLVIRKVTDR